VPVVGTDEVGIPEIVQPGWGALVPPHDPAALAGALVEILRTDPAERAEMGAAGRTFVCAGFSTAAQADRLAELISGR
jgi:glycosyltransferase involved in cell wall biosynthesis